MATRHTTILVVDDDPNFCALVADLLSSAGFDAAVFGDAARAIEGVRVRPPDAAILDVGLPGVSGYGLCRELRELFGEELPVMFVSGERVEAIDRTVGILVGGDDYLVKPVDLDELLARLRRLLGRAGFRDKPTSTNGLSDREIEVLQLLAEGLPPTEVARRLVIAPKTVASHVQRIFAKLDVHTRAQAVAVAYESGLIRVGQNGNGNGTGDDVHAHVAAAPLGS